MMDVVTVGWLTIDDIVLTDHSCHPEVLGGGALYSAVGAQIWARQVGIHSVTGRPFIDKARAAVRQRGLDAEGIVALEGNGLQLWLLHESAEAKQQVPKLTSSTAGEMDAGRGPLPAAYGTARGFHIAPQSPAGSLDTIRRLHRLPGPPVITLDLLSDEFIDRTLYADLAFLDAVTAFLPSEAEIARIWKPADLHGWLRRQAAAHGCHMGVKLGEQGSVVCDAASGSLHCIPAFPARVVDTTGAGDAYCGGFLAGLVAGRPVFECAAMGTVSASYVVETCGALATAVPCEADRDERLKTILSGAVVLSA
jgi:sugar/nucleoside kinase (ribokinase family)